MSRPSTTTAPTTATVPAEEFFDSFVSGYLAGQTTVAARPITFAEIEALAAPDGPRVVHGYFASDPIPGFTTDLTLTPAVFEIDRRAHSGGEVYGTKPGGPKGEDLVPDRKNVVGRRITAAMTTAFRRVTDLTLFTNADAEQATRETGGIRPDGPDRLRLYLADDNADQVPLAPVNGSYATVSFAMPGISPLDLENRLREVLERDFGVDGQRRVVKVLTSPTEERRVDVTDADGRLVAVNVLSAEVGNLMEKVQKGPISTRPSAGHDIVLGG